MSVSYQTASSVSVPSAPANGSSRTAVNYPSLSGAGRDQHHVIDVPPQAESGAKPEEAKTEAPLNRCSWKFVKNLIVPLLACAFVLYCFWLGGTAASITANSRNASNGVQNINKFPGQFYNCFVTLAIFGIGGACMTGWFALISLGRNWNGLDTENDNFFIKLLWCVFGSVLFIIGAITYWNYRDLGLDYIKATYDPYDDRYSGFAAAQLSTMIINAVPTLVTIGVGVVLIVSNACDRCTKK